MRSHFISDDSFFLTGAREIKATGRRKCFQHHTDTLPAGIHPQYGDIVVVNITDIARRQQILLSPWVAYCRVIILLRTKNDGQHQTRGHFPWIIPAGIRLHALESVLSRAAGCEPVIRGISRGQQQLFHYLCHGYSPAFLEKIMKVPAKHLYALKLRTLKKYGLSNGHAVGVLLCRDLTGITCRHHSFAGSLRVVSPLHDGHYPAPGGGRFTPVSARAETVTESALPE